MKDLALYVHIPFCAKKCAYCDFLSGQATVETQREYVTVLCEEIRREAAIATEYRVISVFFGGGTPSILEQGLLAQIMETIRSNYKLLPDAEITVECNPGTLTADKLSEYRKAGVNRLSIGLQSADNAELKLLGRIHTWEQFLESYELARKAGFDNINIDLMSALPGQTLANYEQTLRKVLALQPEHISAYSLIIEEGTPFYEQYRFQMKMREMFGGMGVVNMAGNSKEMEEELRDMCEDLQQELLPDEWTERRMYERTKEVLEEAGYYRYEISNYAKPGRECRHNLCYWERTEYLGFGIGAASLFQECRFDRIDRLTLYISKLNAGESTRTEEEVLTQQMQMEEYMFLGLRKMQGVSISGFAKLYGVEMQEVYGDVIRKYQEYEMLQIEQDWLRLTPDGINVSNRILSEFLLD